jgi:hypothetical protein
MGGLRFIVYDKIDKNDIRLLFINIVIKLVDSNFD